MSICVINGPGSPNARRGAGDTARGLVEELHIFFELREIGSRSSVQSIDKKTFTYTPMFRNQRF